MIRPESIDDIFMHPDATLNTEGLRIPDEFAEAAEHTTLYGIHGVLATPGEIIPHRASIDGLRWLVTSSSMLYGPDENIAVALAETARSKDAHWQTEATSTQLRTIEQREQYAYEKAVKKHTPTKRQRKNAPISNVRFEQQTNAHGVTALSAEVFKPEDVWEKPDAFSEAFMKIIWGSGSLAVHRGDFRLTSAEVRQLQQAMQTRKPSRYNGTTPDEAWDMIQSSAAVEATLFAQRDLLIAQSMVDAIIAEYAQARSRNERFSHGMYMLSPLDAGVTYLLFKAGMPQEHVAPVPSRLTDEQDDDTQSAQDGVRFLNHEIIPLQDTIPDPLTRVILKQRVGLPVTEADRAHLLITLRLLFLPAEIYEAYPQISLNRHAMFFTHICSQFTMAEVETLYLETQTMNLRDSSAHFKDAFNQKMLQDRANRQAQKVTTPTSST